MVDEAEATEDSISMCEEHASVFVAPLGWLYTDHRTDRRAVEVSERKMRQTEEATISTPDEILPFAASERKMRQTEEATIYSLEVSRLDVGDEAPDGTDQSPEVTASADQLLTAASQELEIQQLETQLSEGTEEISEERDSMEEETTPLLSRAFRTTQSLLK